MNEEVFLQVKGLFKSFGGVTAVANVSFDLHKGETLGIIGPNGSGKTTLVNLITRFVKQDLGEVFFKGKKISQLKAYKIAEMGIVRTFQIMRPFYTLARLQEPHRSIVLPEGAKDRWRQTGRQGRCGH